MDPFLGLTRSLGAGHRCHPLSNGDGQVTNRAYNLGRTWTTPKWCKWGNANGHTTWCKEAAFVGDGQGQPWKGAPKIQRFCGQVLMRGEFRRRRWSVVEHQKISVARKFDHKFLGLYVGPFKVLEKIFPDTYKLELLENLKVHPIFHVSLLKPIIRDASRINRKHNSRPSLDLVHNVKWRLCLSQGN